MSIVKLCSHNIEDVCRCLCHTLPRPFIDHIVACCRWCDGCGLNINRNSWIEKIAALTDSTDQNPKLQANDKGGGEHQ